jgi:hypothetical protein
MLQSQKRASRCREIASKAFLAKNVSGGGLNTPPIFTYYIVEVKRMSI